MVSELFGQYFLKSVLRYFQVNMWARIFTVVAMLAVFFLVGLGIFAFSYAGFKFSQTEDFLAAVAPLFIYEMFLLPIGFLVFVSAVISSIFSFFRKQERSMWIMVSPVYQISTWVGFAKVVLSSSWPFILIAFPIFLSSYVLFDISLIGFLLSFFAVLAFTMFSAILGILAVFASACLARLLSGRVDRFKILISFSLFFVFLFGYVAWNGMFGADFFDLFQVDNMELAVATSDRMVEHFKYYPSHYPALALFNAQTGDIPASASFFLISILMMLSSFAVFLIFKTRHFSLWKIFVEGAFEARKSTDRSNEDASMFSVNRVLSGSRAVNSPSQVLFWKELLVNVRTSQNVLWAGFLTLLMLLLIVLVPAVGGLSVGRLGAEGISAVVAMQFATVIFFVGAFVLRFVFPSFSQEGSAAWILGSSPIDLKSVFYQKMKFYLVVNVLISMLASVFFYIQWGQLDINLTGIELAAFFGSVLLFVSAITIVGLSLGVLFANFKIEDPELMGTSLPGMFLVGVFVIFGMLGGFAVYEFVVSDQLINLVILSANLVVFAAMALLFGLRSLKNIEFGV